MITRCCSESIEYTISFNPHATLRLLFCFIGKRSEKGQVEQLCPRLHGSWRHLGPGPIGCSTLPQAAPGRARVLCSQVPLLLSHLRPSTSLVPRKLLSKDATNFPALATGGTLCSCPPLIWIDPQGLCKAPFLPYLQELCK